MTPAKDLFKTMFRAEEVLSWPIDPKSKYYHKPDSDFQIFIGSPHLIKENVWLGDRVFIGPSTLINSNVVIQKDVFIGPYTTIESNITIEKYARIGSFCRIAANSLIGRDARVENSVILGRNFTLAPEKDIPSGILLDSNLKLQCSLPVIYGSKHAVYWRSKTRLAIGCDAYPIDFWLEKYRKMGEIAGYSEKEIEEYYEYIKLMIKLGQPFN